MTKLDKYIIRDSSILLITLIPSIITSIFGFPESIAYSIALSMIILIAAFLQLTLSLNLGGNCSDKYRSSSCFWSASILFSTLIILGFANGFTLVQYLQIAPVGVVFFGFILGSIVASDKLTMFIENSGTGHGVEM